MNGFFSVIFPMTEPACAHLDYSTGTYYLPAAQVLRNFAIKTCANGNKSPSVLSRLSFKPMPISFKNTIPRKTNAISSDKIA